MVRFLIAALLAAALGGFPCSHAHAQFSNSSCSIGAPGFCSPKTVSGGGGGTTAFDPVNLGTAITLSNSNLTATPNTAANDYYYARSLTNHALGSAGKFYYEFAITENGTFNVTFGVCNSSAPSATASPGVSTGTNAAVAYSDNPGGGISINNVTSGTTPSIVTGHTVGIAIDFAAELIWLRDTASPTTWNAGGTANPATGVGGISISALSAGSYYACVYQFNASGGGMAVTANFGATSYAATIPSGFANW